MALRITITPMARLIRDGVGLGYEERGAGEPALVLMHGILCSRRYLAPQLAHFSRRHRTVSIDLRGHGESDAPDQEYTIDVFVDDIAWMCEQLELARPILIGHSLGGIIALAAAAYRPTLPAAIVALDSVLVPPPDRAGVMRELFISLRSGDHVSAAREYFSLLFGSGHDAELRRWILEEIGHVPRHVALSAWENAFFNFDTAAAARACRLPFLYIDAGTPNVNLEQLGRLCPTLVIGRTVGAGHFHQLEVPDQINAMIDRFLGLLSWAG
ncbi:MAG: alpha/beta hydrolase [Pseudomonadota bacterium]|nr:alpha/beta hydrolase [Pseudomonadota bacterium]